jgi:hypothetical protein
MQQLYMNGITAMIECLFDIRTRMAYGVVKKTSQRGMSPRSRSSSKMAFRQTFYSACNAYHQIHNGQNPLPAVSRLLHIFVKCTFKRHDASAWYLYVPSHLHMMNLPRDN